jgi:hypothetical protein
VGGPTAYDSALGHDRVHAAPRDEVALAIGDHAAVAEPGLAPPEARDLINHRPRVPAGAFLPGRSFRDHIKVETQDVEHTIVIEADSEVAYVRLSDNATQALAEPSVAVHSGT